MSNSVMLLQLVLIGVVIYAPLIRFRLFRRLVGYADLQPGVDRGNGSGFAQIMVHLIAKSGKDEAIEQDGVMTFRCTLGLRLVTMAILGLLIFQIAVFGFVGAMDVFYFLVVVALSIYFAYYLFVFRLQVYGSEIVWVDWLLRERTHDMAQLISVEQDKSGGYRLEFLDGQTAYVFRYVEGHGILKDFLLETLRINRS